MSNIAELDSTLVDAVTLANALNYSINNDISYISKYVNDNNVTMELVELYIDFLFDIIEDMNERDFDLQYTDSIISNNVFQRQQKKDTVLTLSIIDSVNQLTPGVKYEEQDIFLLLQQSVVNGIKYQCKYAMTSLQQLLHLMKIIDKAPSLFES